MEKKWRRTGDGIGGRREEIKENMEKKWRPEGLTAIVPYPHKYLNHPLNDYSKINTYVEVCGVSARISGGCSIRVFHCIYVVCIFCLSQCYQESISLMVLIGFWCY